MKCNICPRKCNVDVLKNFGYCGKSGNKVKIAKVMRHFWEEPLISYKKGSGAIFFSNCSLKCCYCQNYQISHLGCGKECSLQELVEIIKKLDDSGVENINFVTPTHYTDIIINALKIYKPKVPVVWNTSGYETEENIELLKDFVDIFLFDFKYYDSNFSNQFSKAKDYFQVCLKALIKVRQIIPEDIVINGKMHKGIIIRHLVLPEMSKDSIQIFNHIKNNLGCDLYISLMSQYLPFYKAKEIKQLNKKITPLEYKKVVAHLKNLGFVKGYLQDYSSSTSDYTPDFSIEKFYEI